MTNTKTLEPEIIRRLLRYEPETGKLFWRERSDEFFCNGRYKANASAMKWNNQNAGKEALVTLSRDGYAVGEIMGRGVMAHRVAWCIYHGMWPIDCIDHIDGDRLNNKIVNLREATRSQNARNRGATSGAKSKFCGVSYSARYKSKPWQATIRVDGKNKYLGRFHSEVEAAAAYDVWARAAHGDFARLNFPAVE